MALHVFSRFKKIIKYRTFEPSAVKIHFQSVWVWATTQVGLRYLEFLVSSSLVEQLQGCMACPEISSLEVGNHCQSTIAFHFDIFSYNNKYCNIWSKNNNQCTEIAFDSSEIQKSRSSSFDSTLVNVLFTICGKHVWSKNAVTKHSFHLDISPISQLQYVLQSLQNSWENTSMLASSVCHVFLLGCKA